MIYLGIDCGTQSTKTVALDGETGKITRLRRAKLRRAARACRQDTWNKIRRPGLQAVDATVQKVLQDLGGRRKEVPGIGVSGQQHGFVPLDGEAQVIRPAKLWCDTSTVEECDLLRQQFGGAKFFIERVGLGHASGFYRAKNFMAQAP